MSDAVQQKLLIISRDTLIEAQLQPTARKVFRKLASLNRAGFHLLLTAPEPDHWVPTRGNVDNALVIQGKMQDAIRDAGAELDGVYYVPRSLFTQDRNREGALRDILQRYAAKPGQAILISSSIPFLKAAARLGIQTHELEPSGQSDNNLLNILKKFRNSAS